MVVSLLDAIFTVIEAVSDLSAAVESTKRVRRTGSDRIVEVPANPKPLSPAAQRALAEAEERERARQSSQD
jgi:hypothetical protein